MLSVSLQSKEDQMKKRIISLFLVLCMMLTVFPVSIFATEGEITPTPFVFTLTGEKNVEIYDSYYGEFFYKRYNGWVADLISINSGGDLVTINATAVGEDGETPIALKVALLRIGYFGDGSVEEMIEQEFVSGFAAFTIMNDATYKVVIFADEGAKGTVSGSYTIESDAVVTIPSRVDATLPFETEYELGSEAPVKYDMSVAYSVQYRVSLSAGEEMTVTAMGKDSPIPVDLKFYTVEGKATSGCFAVKGGNASDNMGVVSTFTAPTDGYYAVDVRSGNITAVGTVSVSITSRATGAVDVIHTLTPDATVESIPSTFTFDKDSCKTVVKDYRAAIGKAFAVTLGDKEALRVDFYGVDEAVDTFVSVYDESGYHADYNDDTYSDGKGEICNYMNGAGEYLVYLFAPIDYTGSLKVEFKQSATFEEIAVDAEKITLGEDAITRSFKYSNGITAKIDGGLYNFDVFKVDLTVGTTLCVNGISDMLNMCFIDVYRVLEDGSLEHCIGAETHGWGEACSLKYSPVVSGTYLVACSGELMDMETLTVTVSVKDGVYTDPQDVMKAFSYATEVSLPYSENITIPSVSYIVSTSPSGGMELTSLRSSSDTVEAYGVVKKLNMTYGDRISISFNGATDQIDTRVWIYGKGDDGTELLEYFDSDNNDGMGESATFTAPYHDTTYYFFFGTTDEEAVGKTCSVAVAEDSSLPKNAAENLLVSDAPYLVLPIETTFTVSDNEIIANDWTVYGVPGRLELAKGEVLTFSVEGIGDDVDTRIWVYKYNRTKGCYEYLSTIDDDNGTTEYASSSYNLGEAGTFTATEAGKYGFVFGTVEKGSVGYTVGIKLSSSIKAMTLAELFASDDCIELSLSVDSTFVAPSDPYVDAGFMFHGIARYKELSAGDSISYNVKGPDACAIMFKYNMETETFEYYDSNTNIPRGLLTDSVSGTFTVESAGTYGIFFGSMQNGAGDTFAYAVASGTTVPTPSGSPAFGDSGSQKTCGSDFKALFDDCEIIPLPFSDTLSMPMVPVVESGITCVGVSGTVTLGAGQTLNIIVGGKSESFPTVVGIYRRSISGGTSTYYLESFNQSEGGQTISFTATTAGSYMIFLGSTASQACGEDFGVTISVSGGSTGGGTCVMPDDLDDFAIDPGTLPFETTGFIHGSTVFTTSDEPMSGYVYKVAMSSGDSIDVTCTPVDEKNGFDTKIMIYYKDAQGKFKFIGFYDNDAAGVYGEKVNFIANEDGTYYFFVGSYEYTAGAYSDTNCTIKIEKGLSASELFEGARVLSVPSEFDYTLGSEDSIFFAGVTIDGFVATVNVEAGKSVNVKFAGKNPDDYVDTVLELYRLKNGKYTFVGRVDNGSEEEMVFYGGDEGETFGIIFRSWSGDSTDVCTVSLSYVEYDLISGKIDTIPTATLPSYNDRKKSDFENVIIPTGMGVLGCFERFTLDSERSLAIRTYGKDVNVLCNATLYRITETGEWELMETDDSFEWIGDGRHLWFASLEAGDYIVVYDYLDVEANTVHTEIVSYRPNMTEFMDFTSATEDMSGDKWAWDNENRILYLEDGFEFVSGNMEMMTIIGLPDGSTIMVSGNVEITSLNLYAIYGDGALTVMTCPDDEYKATLTIKDSYVGIIADGDLKLENINFNFSGYNTAVVAMGSCSFISCNTDIDTHYEMQGVVAYDLLVKSGTFKVVAGTGNIYVYTGVSLVDTEVDLRCSNSNFLMSVIIIDGPTRGYVTIEGSGSTFDAYYYGGETAEVTSDDLFISGRYFFANDDVPVRLVTKVTTIPGDVNGDGRINVRDVFLARQFLSGNLDPSAVDMEAADVNNDGRINATDVRILRTMIAGKI